MINICLHIIPLLDRFANNNWIEFNVRAIILYISSENLGSECLIRVYGNIHSTRKQSLERIFHQNRFVYDSAMRNFSDIAFSHVHASKNDEKWKIDEKQKHGHGDKNRSPSYFYEEWR